MFACQRFLRGALLAVASVFAAAPIAIASAAVLESANLRLEVTAAPYSYSVTEISTGTVLLSTTQTQFTLGTAGTVTQASIVGQTATSLDATAILSGTTDTAHIRWTFVNPDVIQVQLSYDNGAPTNIKEQFLDQGERNYGIWEYSYWGTGGSLDNRGANNRTTLGASGPPQGSGDPSARAPFYWTSRKYGIYIDSMAFSRYTIGLSGQTSFNFDAPQITYYVIHGTTPAQILAQYATLAGGSLMPPDWAFDPVFWRDDHHQDLAANGVANAQALVLKDADQLQAFQMPSGGMFIDRPVGTGTGALASRVLAAVPAARVTAIDSDAAMLGVARRRLRGRVRTLTGSFLTVPLPASDAITASFALHHVPTRRRKAAFYAQCFDVLRPGGVLVNADCALSSSSVLQARDRAAWLAHLQGTYSRRRAQGFLRAWAREDVYFPLDVELTMMRAAGFAPDIVWRQDCFAVVVATRSSRRPAGST